jgi:Domain of unknown function (DUF4252)
LKNLIYLVVISFYISAGQVTAQNSVKNIVRQLKKTEHYEGISLPGWVIRLGMKIAESDEKDTLGNFGLKQLVGKIKHLRIATTLLDSKKYNSQSIVNNFIKSVVSKDGFEEYVSVRSEDQHLKILIREDDDRIKNLLVLSNEGEELSLIHLKTNISSEDLKSLSFSQIKKDSGKVHKKAI